MKKLLITAMKKLLILLLFLSMFGVGSAFAQQSCGTNIDQCTVNLQGGDTVTTYYPTNLSTTLEGGLTATNFKNHRITWNGCTPSATCPGPVSFSYYASADNGKKDFTVIEISLTGTGTWSNGAIQYSVTGGSVSAIGGVSDTQSTAAVLD